MYWSPGLCFLSVRQNHPWSTASWGPYSSPNSLFHPSPHCVIGLVLKVICMKENNRTRNFDGEESMEIHEIYSKKPSKAQLHGFPQVFPSIHRPKLSRPRNLVDLHRCARLTWHVAVLGGRTHQETGKTILESLVYHQEIYGWVAYWPWWFWVKLPEAVWYDVFF